MPNRNPDTATAADPREDLRLMKDDIGRLKQDLQKVTSSLGQAARNEAREIQHTVQEQVKGQLHNAEEYVQSRPIVSVLGAFGIGFVMGTVMTLKRR